MRGIAALYRDGFPAARIGIRRRAAATIANLGDADLDLADPVTHAIRLAAAGRGWFVDPTPHDGSEFLLPSDQGEQDRMDLLSVVAHELGHLLGLDDLYGEEHAGDLMAATLTTGTRRTPTPAEVSETTAGVGTVEKAPQPSDRRSPPKHRPVWLWAAGPRLKKSILFADWLMTANETAV